MALQCHLSAPDRVRCGRVSVHGAPQSSPMRSPYALDAQALTVAGFQTGAA